jgi:hypothetical protein
VNLKKGKGLTEIANANMDTVIRLNIKQIQGLPARRRPYHRRYANNTIIRSLMPTRNPGPLMHGKRVSDGIGIELAVDDNGYLYITGAGSGGTSSNFNSAFPAAGTAVGASDGTNMKPLLVDGSGNLKIAGSFSASTPTFTTATSTQITVGTTAVLALCCEC